MPMAKKKRTVRRRDAITDDPGPQVRRWTEQRWILDNTIRAVGIEWDQPRLGNYATACGPLSAGDLAAIRQRVQKYADITPAFEAAARRREAVARLAEADGHAVTAGDSYYMASVFWAASQWTLLVNDAHNRNNNARKRACFLAYAKHADHRVEAAWIPLPGGKAIPGWLHLPYGYGGGRVPAVVSIPGMDGFKESNVALLGDRWLSRGIAVLVIDGPGQYESVLLDIPFTMPAWKSTGKAAYEWLRKRAEIDAARIGLLGNSFGSFFATIAAAWEPRYRAVAVSSICLEPGAETIFEQASPTFKRRFMYMAGIDEEDRFDRFRRTITWKGHAGRIRMPYLCVAGERDELCPLVWAERMMEELRGPKQLVVYRESRHTVGNVPSAVLGPPPPVLVADWMQDRLSGKPLASSRWFVDASGNVLKSGF
jgi:dipeptidyl aminopeptidase/acylaminoacyl peptidase